MQSLQTGDRPIPRAPRSASKARRIQSQNRRRQWLDDHPEYFDSRDHEFADPVLYDKLIRRHQSAAERESDGKTLGYARILESDIVRSEAKLADLSASMATSRLSVSASSDTGGFVSLWALDQRADEEPAAREEACEMWREYLRDRFISGGDEEFDYEAVDGDEGLDQQAARDAEEKWFDDDEPRFVESESESESESEGTEEEKRARRRQRAMRGETGIQDF
ncbi:hypothetical protein TD95_002891 [Thielaviopsis punctulata]|uniref:CCD97-like C-terminal domain-containing protein n=1 Tax=Thielaviopsis punctulata TaxID=72032 RepID=A0A0F4ZDC4_9PEZI|nr:hypothetical protein TD95_002891 [Thielaviopsis punctulata]